MTNLLDDFNLSELSIIDIQFLGLKKKAWQFSRGMRTVREYHYQNDTVAVRDIYTYVTEDGGRTVTSVTRTIEWYDGQGVKILEKDISPDLNIKNKKDLNRDIRQGRIDYMIAAAEELAILSETLLEPFKSQFIEASNSIDIILSHYETPIDHYIKFGNKEFEDAVNNESNPIMLNILNLMVRPPDAEFVAGLTIKQTIIHQLTGEYNP